MKEASVDRSVDSSQRPLLSRSGGSTESGPSARDIQEAANGMGMSVLGFCTQIEMLIPDATSPDTADRQVHGPPRPLPTSSIPQQVDLMDRLCPGLGSEQPWEYVASSPDHEMLTAYKVLDNLDMEEPDFLDISNQSRSGSVNLNFQGATDTPRAPTQISLSRNNSAVPVVISDSESSSGSSWVVPTPGSNQSKWSPSNSQEHDESVPGTPDEEPKFAHSAPGVSKNYIVARRTRRPRARKEGTQNATKKRKTNATSRPGKRGPFTDEKARKETAQTRILKSCIRCRMQAIRCAPDLLNPDGVCLTCKNVTVTRQIHKLPCLRWMITDSSLYREQKMPYQLFSRRWQSMDLVDVDTWASDEVKTAYISQIYLDAPHVAKVRRFIPIPGEMVEEQWMSGSVVKTHPVPKYALADIHESAKVIEEFIDASVGNYIYATVGRLDDLLWHTYLFAFQYQPLAKTLTCTCKKTVVEQELILDCFRLWVACRKTSHPEHIYGYDKLGGSPVDDPESPFHNLVPAPIIITVQLECILYTKVLRPKSKKVLRKLNDLVKENKREYWLTIYLTMFILLHSCSLITRRDKETAEQYNLSETYANPKSIAEHHSGCQTMLAHFHYLNKGVLPFQLTEDMKGLEELKKAANLDNSGLKFVRKTARRVKNLTTDQTFKTVRDKKDFGHDLFWVSQLYDENWKPGPTA